MSGFASLLLILLSTLAWCAQDATVTKDNSPVRQDPNQTSKIIDYFQAGEELRLSSYPVNKEFYKVRARNGQYGWIHIRYVSIEKPPEGEDSEDDIPEPQRDRRHSIRVFGGFDFFKPQDLNDVFGFNELNYGYNAGAEYGFGIGMRMSLLFRVEALLKNVVAKETTTNLVYNLSLRSYPIMGGLDFKILKDPPIKLSVSVYAGIATRTSFTAEALNQNPPNETTIQSSDFTSLITLNVIRPLGRTFSVFASGGYRHLKTGLQDVTNGNNGGQVFRISGVWKPRVIDLSGFIFNLGLGVHL